MWHRSNFSPHKDCFSVVGLVFNRTIILMREINIRQTSRFPVQLKPAHDWVNHRFSNQIQIMMREHRDI
ncbi:hypothetical protein B4923_11475 [Brenneria roseae subsp. americana]|uniref:Uncharacterized protein n=1 Tax=Brenneria roseae subsp. americana TaxID=1508507 RepID=A0A2U1TRA0_9GAMM|nr:hypothetical protein B4923_11475 [Brenneria roseae subsp. americana]